MSTLKRGDFLRDRAERFLRNARELFARQEYDLAAFNAEQSAHLFLKHALWNKLGDFEKTHEISNLLDDFREVSKDKQAVDAFKAAHIAVVGDLEIAYIESRYLPVQFLEEQVQKMLDFVEAFKSLLQTQ